MKRLYSLIFVCFLLFSLHLYADKNHSFEISKQLNIFNRAYKTLDEFYVDTLKAEKLIPEALQYLMEGLDPYTEYIPANDTRNFKSLTSGKYAGIGAIIRYSKKHDRCIIYEPYEGMPAAIAGLRSGDVILRIGDKELEKCGKTPVDEYTTKVSNLLRGDPKTTFEIKVQRPGVEQPLTMSICRANIKVPSVNYYGMVGDSIGYVILTQFTQGCAEDVHHAIQQLQTKGAQSLILDIRDNGGGLAIEAVDLVNLFTPKGQLVLSMKGKYASFNSKYYSRHTPAYPKMPLVVLVNGHSASASEITCGALQDFDRAVIMGERTYGKGLVQQPHELPYGAMMKLTTSHYYIPSGRCIQALDYTRRSDTGEAYRTPDSLTHLFHTAAGRPVRDGGGITPDIEAKQDSMPNLIYYLSNSDQLQDFCVQYRNAHETIAPAGEFCISDSDYNDFKRMLLKSDFTYDRQTYKGLQQLRKMAVREGYGEVAKKEFDALEKKLTRDLGEDLDKWKGLVKQTLTDEIALRYYFKRGYHASALRHDTVLQQAIRLLQNPKAYEQTLRKK